MTDEGRFHEQAPVTSFPLEEETPYWKGVYADPMDAAIGQSSRASQGSEPSTAQIRQMYAARAVRERDHITAGLLAVFLGAFGIHKFYLGYNQTAFIMLAVSVIGSIVTLGLAGAVVWLIAVIEGVIYLTKSQTEFDRIYVLGQRDWF